MEEIQTGRPLRVFFEEVQENSNRDKGFGRGNAENIHTYFEAKTQQDSDGSKCEYQGKEPRLAFFFLNELGEL